VEETVTVPSPPTAESVVTWCGGDRTDTFIVKGVQRMLDRYVETCGLAEDHKRLCGKLRAYVDWWKLGLGGEHLEDLVLADARESRRLLEAASHALKSYAYGNAATDLAKDLAFSIDAFIATGQPQTLLGKQKEQSP
jgi:hypothetical protein